MRSLYAVALHVATNNDFMAILSRWQLYNFLGLYVNYTIFLSECIQILNFSTDFFL
jgi:hypothetical protein